MFVQDSQKAEREIETSSILAYDRVSTLQPCNRRKPTSPRHGPLPKLLLIPYPARHRSRRHGHKLIDQEPQRRRVPAQCQASAYNPIPRPFEPFQHIVRRQNVLEPSGSGWNGVHFVVGDLRLALALSLALRGAATEGEELVFGGNVACQAEEEEDEAQKRRQGWEGDAGWGEFGIDQPASDAR